MDIIIISLSILTFFTKLYRYNKTPLTMVQCCKNTWAKEGVRGFFRGLVVSYATIGELIVYFSIYEKIKVNVIKV